MFRTLGVFFRPANIAYFAHILLTSWSELLYTMSFLKMTSLTTDLADLPGKPILLHLFDDSNLAVATRQAR